jgi:predicted lipid-binding transport protein (Tim44 family)
MGGGFQYLDIVVLAIFAGVILYRLSSVLGRRTGQERQRYNPYAGGKPEARDNPRDNGLNLPKPSAPARKPAGDLGASAAKAGPLSGALTEIQIADRNFDLDQFLAGARIAYEMIVTAFAKGDRRGLKNLLSDEVYQGFEDAIVAREARGETIESHFVGIKAAEPIEAVMKGREAEITLKITSEMISFTKNADGAVIEGDPTTVHEIHDQWTFGRDTRSSDPNWKLIAANPA